MSWKKIIVVWAVLVAGQEGRAQKQVMRVEQVWLAYFNHTRLSDRWGFLMDAQFRTAENFFNRFSLSAIRAGGTFYVNDRTTVTAGYAYFHYYPGDNHRYVAQPEHRGWQQLQWTNANPRFRFNQRIRMEQRFRRKIHDHWKLAEGYHFNYRARYSMQLALPLSKRGFAPHTFSVVAAEEVMVNFGKQVVYNTFDQNRLSAGFAYHFGRQASLQVVYMNQFQQQSSGNQYRSIHYGRLSYLHNLDARKTTSQKS